MASSTDVALSSGVAAITARSPGSVVTLAPVKSGLEDGSTATRRLASTSTEEVLTGSPVQLTLMTSPGVTLATKGVPRIEPEKRADRTGGGCCFARTAGCSYSGHGTGHEGDAGRQEGSPGAPSSLAAGRR